MKLDVTQAIRNAGTVYPFRGEQAMAPQDIAGDTVTLDDAQLEGTFVAMENGDVVVDGKLTTVAHARCAYCLAPVSVSVTADYRETFIYGGDPEDDEVFSYNSGKIDLERLALTYTVLNLPMRFICEDGCAGIGDWESRGVSVRLSQEELPGQHPFAALKQLLAEQAGESDD